MLFRSSIEQIARVDYVAQQTEAVSVAPLCYKADTTCVCCARRQTQAVYDVFHSTQPVSVTQHSQASHIEIQTRWATGLLPSLSVTRKPEARQL